MPGPVFKNLINMKILNKRRIAIYYLNNLCPINNRIDLDSKDFIKKLVDAGIVSANDIDDDITQYYMKKIKGTSYVENLLKIGFVHKSASERYKI